MKKCQKISVVLFMGLVESLFSAALLERVKVDLTTHDVVQELSFVGTGSSFEDCVPKSYEHAFERYNRVFPDVLEKIEAKERLSKEAVTEIKSRVKAFCEVSSEYIAQRVGGQGWTVEELICVNYIWLKQIELMKNFENRSLQDKWIRWMVIVKQFPLHLKEVMSSFGFEKSSLNQKDVFYQVKKMASDICKQKLVSLITLLRGKPGNEGGKLILDRSMNYLSYSDFVAMECMILQKIKSEQDQYILGGFYRSQIQINNAIGWIKNILLYNIQDQSSKMIFFLEMPGKEERVCGVYDINTPFTELLDLFSDGQ